MALIHDVLHEIIDRVPWHTEQDKTDAHAKVAADATTTEVPTTGPLNDEPPAVPVIPFSG